MFVFVLDAELLQLTFQRPALAALLQLPPTIGKFSRYQATAHVHVYACWVDLIQPPTIRPTSLMWRDQIS